MDGDAAHIGTWIAEGGASETADMRSSEVAPDSRTIADLARVQGAGQGDVAAQSWLLGRVMARVRRIARTFLSSAADADDAAQVALLAILKSAPTYRGEAAVEAWAGRIAVRSTLRLVAQQKRERALAAEQELLPEDEVTQLDVSRAAEALPRDLREYLAKLPEPQRIAILLHHGLDHTVDEIAEMTDVSPDTIKSRLRLGLAALRKHIRQDIAIGRRRSA